MLKAAATLFVVGGLSTLSPLRAADRPKEGALDRYEYQQVLMGVPVRVLVYSANEALANSAVHAAFNRIRQLNLIFSDYDEDSEISRLARSAGDGKSVPVSAELAVVLARSLEISRLSNGAFDVTVGPLVELWRKARRTKTLPSSAALTKARSRVGYSFVHLDQRARTVVLERPGMRLDFGGIVKGYAADEARRVLRARGLDRTLVALAGDISAGEPPPGRRGWRISLQGLAIDDSQTEDAIWLRNAAVSTAGDAYQFVEIGGQRYSHLIDPQTGLGLTRRVNVTVIAPHGIDSDGLDSAAAVLGPDRGMQLLRDARKRLSPVPSKEGRRGSGFGPIEARFLEATPNGVRTFQTEGFTKFLVTDATAAPSSPATTTKGTH